MQKLYTLLLLLMFASNVSGQELKHGGIYRMIWYGQDRLYRLTITGKDLFLQEQESDKNPAAVIEYCYMRSTPKKGFYVCGWHYLPIVDTTKMYMLGTARIIDGNIISQYSDARAYKFVLEK